MPFLNTDIPELTGFDTGLCLSNLDILAARQDRLSESMLAMLSELADAIIRDAAGDPDTVDSILLSLQSMPDGEEEDKTAHPMLERVAPVNREAIARMSTHSGLYARLLLYAMLEERTPAAPPAKPLPLLPQTVRGRIAYMPAAFADKAYLKLAAGVNSPRAAATASFVDACEEVRGGLCEYCILPLESTHSGKLAAFTRLILRYNLRVVAVCDLENGAADGQITRFALLRAADGAFPTPLTTPAEGESLYLEFIHRDGASSLTELLTAAEFCGVTVCRLDTLPLYDELDMEAAESASVGLVCDVAGSDLAVFRRYLTLEASDNILIGLYSSI
ncbi:MAG: hypothetical protein IJD38_02350 [Clostridia bacterium]|nr:hypothetical protein [Clostridia bacterium]